MIKSTCRLVYILFLFINLFYWGCKKKESVSNVAKQMPTGSLEIKILKANKSGIETPTINTSIKLYQTDYDRSNNSSTYLETKTDSNGIGRFNALDKEMYYARITNNTYGTMQQTLKVEQNAIGYNTFVYQ